MIHQSGVRLVGGEVAASCSCGWERPLGAEVDLAVLIVEFTRHLLDLLGHDAGIETWVYAFEANA